MISSSQCNLAILSYSHRLLPSICANLYLLVYGHSFLFFCSTPTLVLAPRSSDAGPVYLTSMEAHVNATVQRQHYSSTTGYKFHRNNATDLMESATGTLSHFRCTAYKGWQDSRLDGHLLCNTPFQVTLAVS